jgi:hypothetical protein
VVEVTFTRTTWSDAIEQVEQREAALDLVCFDHALEDILDGDALALACQVVRKGEDGMRGPSQSCSRYT